MTRIETTSYIYEKITGSFLSKIIYFYNKKYPNDQ